MKNALFFFASALMLITAWSCKKENNSPNPNPASGVSLVRIQQGTDADLTNDTVYLIGYDGSSRIVSIKDSVNADSLAVTYDASGNPVTLNGPYFNASFTFDANGILQQLDYILAGSHEQDVFEYTNGVLSKRTHNSNFGSGPLSISGSFTYSFTGGNITDIKEYDLNGTFVKETTCSYGTETNGFKTLSLVNLGNILGADTFLNIETYFNKNMLTGYAVNGNPVSTVYTLNSSQQIVHAVSTDPANGFTFTWSLTYK